MADGVVGDGRGLVVSDHRGQGRHHHHRALDVLFQLGLVQLGALDHELAEVVTHVGHDQRRVQVVVDQDRAEGVQLEVAFGAAHGHRHVGGDDLDGDHQHRLGLGRVDLAWHDRRSGLVGGEDQLVDPGPRARPEPAQIVGDLEQGDGRRLQPGVRAHHPVQRALRGELVGRGLERGPRHRRDLRRHLLAEAYRGVQPSTDRGAAHGQLQQAVGGVLGFGDRVIERADVAGPLLADCQRYRVLQVGPADLDHVGPLSRVAPDRITEPPERRDRLPGRHRVGGDVHRGREGVIGRLAHVHVIVGMDRLLRAEGPAHQLDAPVRDDLVHVHVGLRPRPGLEHIERELGIEGPADHLVTHPLDQLPLPGRQPPGPGIYQGRRFLYVAVGVVHLLRHLVVADVEVLQAPLGLRPPVPVGRHLHRAQAVELLPHPGGLQADRQVEDLRRRSTGIGHGGHSSQFMIAELPQSGGVEKAFPPVRRKKTDPVTGQKPIHPGIPRRNSPSSRTGRASTPPRRTRSSRSAPPPTWQTSPSAPATTGSPMA